MSVLPVVYTGLAKGALTTSNFRSRMALAPPTPSILLGCRPQVHFNEDTGLPTEPRVDPSDLENMESLMGGGSRKGVL